MPDTTIRPPPPDKLVEGARINCDGLELTNAESRKVPRPFDFGDSNVEKTSSRVVKSVNVMTPNRGVGFYLLRCILIPLLVSTILASIVTYIVIHLRDQTSQNSTEQKGKGK